MSTSVALGVAVALLLANAFFVGAEFAIMAARRSQIEPLANAGSLRARSTLSAMEHVSTMLACAQLGVTVCSLGLGAVAEPALAHLLELPFAAARLPEGLVHPVAFAIALAVVVYLHVVVGEMVPKNLAIAGPDRAALLLAPPLVWLSRVLAPLIRVLNGLANACLR
jgi:CBS domain containing-hemolysin-like protein